MRVSRRTLLQGGATALGGALLAGPAWADAPALLRSVALTQVAQGMRLVLGADRPVICRTSFLTDPHRFVVDVADARWALPQGAMGSGPGAGLARGYRFAPRDGGVARIVLDLEAPAELLRQEIMQGRTPGLSFDLAAPGVTAAPAPVEMRGRSAGPRTIVIDAGHGGRDPGAIGATGVREKDVVLEAALQLKGALLARGRYQVALTRDTDRFVELEDRVRFARTQNADLFISLHADSHANHEAHGASVYTLSEGGAARAQNIMGAQNWDLDLGAPRDPLVGDILVDLTQRETTNRSAQFAQTLIPRLGQVSPLLTNTHRNAGFFVLLAPDVPAVLVETGFLSNVADERRLNDQRARQAMAEAAAGAVDAYFTGPQLYAARA